MKFYRLMTLIVLAALTLAACGGGAQESSELNLYAWSEYVPTALLEKFTAETGIKVNYDTYSSNEELLAKLQAGASGYDIIIPSDYTVTILTAQNMLEQIDLGQIPNFKNIDPVLKDPSYDPGNKFTVPYMWGTTGLVVDTSKITQPLTHWAQLWDASFQEQLVMLDDSREVIGLVLMTLGYSKNSTDPAQLEEAKQMLIKLMPNIRLFDSDSPKTALLAGEVVGGLTWNGEASLAHKENAAVDYICPMEGCGIWVDNFAVPKGAPHKDAALKFMNFVLEPANSLLITAEFPYSNPNAAALELLETQDPAAYDAYMSFPGTNPPADFIARAQWVIDIGEATVLWDQIWTEVKGGE